MSFPSLLHVSEKDVDQLVDRIMGLRAKLMDMDIDTESLRIQLPLQEYRNLEIHFLRNPRWMAFDIDPRKSMKIYGVTIEPRDG